jgi:hypothetical protein
MTANKQSNDGRDRTVINPRREYEILYWTKKWNITQAELKRAIKQTGSHNISKLEDFLKRDENLPRLHK